MWSPEPVDDVMAAMSIFYIQSVVLEIQIFNHT